MKYVSLGNSGLKVSELCMGSMTFGRETDEQTSYTMMDEFSGAGGNFIDTANVYSRGTSEEIVGKWLKRKRREDYVIATKVRFPMGDGPNESGLGRAHIMQQVDASLKRLQTDYIDLYQVHCQDPTTPLEETLASLNTLIETGKVRYIGASNFTPSVLQKALDISAAHGWAPFVSLQAKYNLLTRSGEWELLPLCAREGLGFMVWGPLLGGWLSGRYTRDMQAPPKNSRVEQAEEEGWFESWQNYNTEATWQVIDSLLEIAKETGRSPAQVSLNWLLRKCEVTSPIIGARRLEHLRDNLSTAEWSLTQEQMQRLNKASSIPAPYPYDMVQQNCGC